ncbi:MAG: glycosyltransferase family 2 protein [Kiritimatiellales bacterium]
MPIIAQYKKVNRIAVLLPAFNEELTVGGIVAQAKRYIPDVIVIDDASTDATVRQAESAGATVVRRKSNGGKGAALVEGFKYILAQNFDAVIAMDADGFHDPHEIPKFLETYHRTHLPVLIGNRMADARHTLSTIRRWTVQLMSYSLDRFLNVYIPDPPCGFRFYRCDVLPFLLEESTLPSEFETLINVAARRIGTGSVRISRRIRKHKSFISPLRDLVRFARVLFRYYQRRRRLRNSARVKLVREEV